MRILNTYLLTGILRPTLVAVFIMLSLIWLMQSLRFMDLIINKGLDIGTFLWITALIVPSLLIVILPLALFAGGVYAFKRLNDENELVPLLSAGLSRWRIVRPGVVLALAVVAMGYVLSLWLMPAGMRAFKDLQHDIRQSGGNLLLEEGTFNPMGDNMTVYVKRRAGRGDLHGLLVHDTRKPDRHVTWMARQGKIAFSDDGYPRLVLRNGTRQEVSEERLTVLEFTEHTIDITRQIATAGPRWRGVEERYLPELMFADDIPPNEINRFRAEIHKRLVWPLTPVPFILLAGVFLIQGRRRRQGSFRSAAFASAGAVVYQGALMLIGNFAADGTPGMIYAQWALPVGISLALIWVLSDKGRGASVGMPVRRPAHV